MNAPFDPVSFIHRLEAEGIARGAAEAIAQGIEDRNRELATRADTDKLGTKVEKLAGEIEKLTSNLDRFATKAELEKFATKTELKLELQTALARQTVQFGAMLAAAIGLASAIIGTIIALR